MLKLNIIKLSTITALSCYGGFLFANDANEILEKKREEIIAEIHGTTLVKQLETKVFNNLALPQDKKQSVQNAENKATKSQINKNDLELLSQNSYLLEKTFEAAIITLNIPALLQLMPIYENQPVKNNEQSNVEEPVYISYAKGLLAHYVDNNYSEASKYYKKVLEQAPELPSVLLLLANVQMQNYEFKSAEENLDKLPNVSTELMQNWQQSLIEQIVKAQKLKINGNFTILNNKNINKAPKIRQLVHTNGVFTFPKPIEAWGAAYSLGINKEIMLADNFFLDLLAGINGKYYPELKEYNDNQVRLGLEFLFKNAKNQVGLTLQANQRWLTSKVYNKNADLIFNWRHKLTPLTNIFVNGQVSAYKHDKLHHLDGLRTQIYVGASIQASKTTSFIGALSYTRSDVKDLDNSYEQNGMRMGWGQDFSSLFSTYLEMNISRKEHKGVDFFNIVQKTTEKSFSFSIWKKQLNLFGFTPRLVWQYSYTASNHPLYTGTDNNLQLEIFKAF